MSFDIERSGYFGACPTCHRHDGMLNIGREHWFVCHEHRARWSPGSNLFSGWRDEDEADWLVNRAKLAGYAEVEPYMHELASKP